MHAFSAFSALYCIRTAVLGGGCQKFSDWRCGGGFLLSTEFCYWKRLLGWKFLSGGGWSLTARPAQPRKMYKDDFHENKENMT